jgi:PncC family amidohydrolase
MQKIGHDFGIGVTGIAGPTGGTPQKPVGLVYIAVASQHFDICKVQDCHFKGDRLEIKQQTADTALNLLIETKNTLNER